MLSVRMLGLLRLMLLFSDSGSECPPAFNRLTLDPPFIIQEYDEPILVNCTYISAEHDGIYWKVGNLTYDEEYRSYRVLSLPKPEWNTEAQCRIMLSETDECSKDLDITLYKKPDHVIVYPVSGNDPVEGEQYELQCDIVNVAPVQNLTVTWYRNDQIIKRDYFTNTTKTPESESSILPLNISREDDGAEFTCVAQLNLGPDGPQPPVMSNDNYTLSVHYPPEFKINNVTDIISVNKNSDILLNCEAEGNPKPQYKWTKNDVTLSNDTEYLNLIQVNESTSYFCTATNNLRSIEKQFYIIVVAETKTTPAPDVMTNPQAFVPKDCPLTITPPEIVVRYGDPVSVNCSTTSPDVIGIGWEDVETENVSDVTWTVDKLEYWNMNPACFATLKDNSQCETIPNITVYKTPDIVSVSTLNISGPMVQGREFQLICNIINVAPVNSLKVKWYRNNETVHTEMFIDTSVTPKNVSSILKMTPGKDDNGAHFTCVAELHLGGNGPQPVPSEVSEPYIAVVDCPVTITPAEIVVRYGDPASANCSTSVSDAAGMGWEATFGGVGLTTAPTVHWAVKKLEVWDLQPLCFITLKNNDQCDKTLNITVYKTPDKVSILDNGPMVEGKEYHLKCDISDVVPADKVKVKWYRNDEYVQDMVSDTHVDPHNNNISAILTIIPKKDDNGANFTCVAELHLGENGPQPVPAATSEPYIAVVHYKPLFSSCPPYAGKEYEFIMNMVPCQADANPPTVVQWYYHETPINPFVPLTRNQSGKYRAEAENHVGKSSTSVDVTVEYGPSFSCNDRYEVEENGNFYSKCQPEGIPEPDTVWFKDGKQMMESPQIWRRQDSGEYSIVATNKYGKDSHTLYLDVLYAPEFQERNYSREMISGENITLNCFAEGNPSPLVQWYHPPAVNVHTTRGQQSISISVTGATSTNAGVYICGATNKVGSMSRNVTLIMKGETSTIPQNLILVLLILVIVLLFVILIAVLLRRKRKHGEYNMVPNSLPLSTRSNGVRV
ncbi:hemicentin-1 [Sphaeramia orbicularis]|uniref:hemicentin-1 n=1 Tax=Sphaeramia orbicularis TaxID=375764 RepID=UPI00118147E1|nr:hemicentin-1-like [Sphaeramia orbicularis]